MLKEECVLNKNRILIISNNALVESDSNGRTLGCLVENVPKTNIMQICINGNSVSSKYVINSYAISDKSALKSLFGLQCKSRKLKVDDEISEKVKSDISVKRTPFISLAREVVWKQALLKINIKNILGDFIPDVIVVQLGDCSFTLDLACKISKTFGSPIVIFTTEDYYFKKYNHINFKKRDFCFALFKMNYQKSLNRIFAIARCCVCNTPYLAELYRNEFKKRTEIVMNAANFQNLTTNNRDCKKIIYAGNLAHGRYQSLIQVADALRKISESNYIDVYGEFSDGIKKELEKHHNINLKGFTAYQEILMQQASASLVLHVESFEPFHENNLKAAFSTKIPDALSCGSPFFMFAPETLAETKYLKENNCSFVCTDPRNLEMMLRHALEDKDAREEKVRNAKYIVRKNHTHEKNQEIFMRAIEEAVNEDSSN